MNSASNLKRTPAATLATAATCPVRRPDVSAAAVKKPRKFTMGYRCKSHSLLPHVVKFSGGRSSGAMLFKLLESGALSASRGDVVVFNNTSAEHPATYDFVRRCKNECESKHGIPFFLVEYCTYEDTPYGKYIRLPTFRLANADPHSKDNPEGYRWRGEVFEELLSWNGGVPSIFQRTCTMALKMQTTRSFLADWFLNTPQTMRRGHFMGKICVDENEYYERHVKNGGQVPREVFIKKKRFLLSRKHFREGQRWEDFSKSYKQYSNEHVSAKVFGDTVFFGADAVQYVGVVGLRADEERRVTKTLTRAQSTGADNHYIGENVYAPLFTNGCTELDVIQFWNGRPGKLELDATLPLSNCTFCFLKGMENLRLVERHFKDMNDPKLRGTPCDLEWWSDIESRYAKDYEDEGKTTRKVVPDNVIGFFGARGGYLFKYLSSAKKDEEFDDDYPEGFIPCDCTD